MKKRLLSTLLVLCMALALLPGTALAAETSGKCGNNLTWIYSDNTLTIQGTGDMYNYELLTGTPWNRYSRTIQSVTIGDGVTRIGNFAFYDFRSLESVTIPKGVTSIGTSSFNACAGLESVTIPDSVTSIEDLAFMDCSSLPSVTIPDSVTSIGGQAFYRCNSLTSVTIPSRVASIGTAAFAECEKLAGIEVASGNADYSSVDGVLFNFDQTFLHTYPFGKSSQSYSIPDSVTTIGRDAFYQCRNLTGVTIPDSVATIEQDAFLGCDNLTDVTIPGSVASIGQRAFGECDNLTSVTILDGVDSIELWAFEACGRLAGITIPDSVTNIGEYAFYKCGALKDVYYSGSEDQWKQINISTTQNDVLLGAAFHYNSAGPETPWEDFVVKDGVITKYTGAGGVVIIPNGVTGIGTTAFAYSKVTRVIIPDSVTTIGSTAFMSCTNLTSVTIPDSVTSIGEYAFSNCLSLTGVTIPDSITTIGQYVFQASGLTSVTVPDNVTSIGEQAFGYCSNLTSVTIGNGVTTIGNTAFGGCQKLTGVTMGSSVTTIADGAFGSCTKLESVVLPGSVNSIGYGSFYNCGSLATVYYGGSKDQWNKIKISTLNDDLLSAKIRYNSAGPNMDVVFTDVPDGWYHDFVYNAARVGLINGVGNDEFEPESKINRSQFLAVIVRTVYGEPEIIPDAPNWFDRYYAYASANGLLDGIPEDVDKEGEIPRYEMAQMIYNAAVFKGLDDETFSKDFPDSDHSYSSSYDRAIRYAYGMGLINGVDDSGDFAGVKTLERGQAAKVMWLFYELAA